MQQLTIDTRAPSDALCSGYNSNASPKGLAGVGGHELDSLVVRQEMTSITSRLDMGQIILSMRSCFDDCDIQGRICGSEPTCDETRRRPTYKARVS